MISSSVFARYARALVDVVTGEARETDVSRDLELYDGIFAAVPDLLDIFHSPAVPREAKERVLQELLDRYPVSPTTANFLRLLLKQNRIRYFREILDNYTKAINTLKGVVVARVSVAAVLSEADLHGLRDALARATGKTVELHTITDPGLIGGVVVQIDSTVYDGSIRRQLSEIKRRLVES